MKKLIYRALALCLALMLCLAFVGCSPDKAVAAKVDDQVITVKDVHMYANFILLQLSMQYGVMMPLSSLPAADQDKINQEALTYLVDSKVALLQAQSRGLYPLTGSNKTQVDSTVSQLSSSLAQFGLTDDALTQILTEQKAYALVQNAVTKDVTVADNDIKAEYDKEVAAQQQSYTADASAYEKAKSDGTTVVVYKPAGYRYVKHILIAMPSDIASQISTAQSGGDATTVQKMRESGLQQILVKAQEVLPKIQGGADFDTILAQYGEDADMKQEPVKTTGYEVGKLSADAVPTRDAAMALQKVGDISELVPSDYGYYIVKYVGDVPSGPVAFDSVKDALKIQLLTAKKGDAWNAILAKWKTEIKIEQHPEKIPAATEAPTAPAATK